MLLEFQVNAEEFENEREKEERKILSEKIDKLQQLVEKGEGGEKLTQKERYKTFSLKRLHTPRA